MMLDVRNLLQAEGHFLNSFRDTSPSSHALDSLTESWTSLYTTLRTVPLDDDTVDLAHTASSRVTTLAEGLLGFHDKVKSATTGFLDDLDAALHRLDLSKGDGVSPNLTTHQSSDSRQAMFTATRSLSKAPLYIEPAYRWLLKNVHNPYPSKETKELLSRGTNTSVQSIDAWFINARRRIGWTSISKKYFNGSKMNTIAAAFRALTDDLKPSNYSAGERIPLPANIRMAFVEMDHAAKEMYTEKYAKSKLAGKLDGSVKDMTDDDRERRKERKKKEKALEKLKAECERKDGRRRDAQRRREEVNEGYLSQSLEQESSKPAFEPRYSAESEAEDLPPPSPIVGCKRNSPIGPSDEREAANERPTKRSRILSTSSSYSVVENLSTSRQNSLEPFPSSPESSASSTSPPSTPSEDNSTSLPSVAAAPQRRRRRRLSDVDTELMPKRSLPLVRSGLQVVSDPLPKSLSSASPVDETNILEWCQFLNQPSTAAIGEPDASGPFELNMFDYSQFADYVSSGETSEGTDWEGQGECLKDKGSTDSSSLSSNPAIHVPSLTFADFDLPTPISVLPDFELDLCTSMGWPYPGDIQTKSSLCDSTFHAGLDKLDGLTLPLHPPFEVDSSEHPLRSDDVVFDPLDSIDWSSIIPQTIPSTTEIAPAAVSPTVCPRIGVESRAEKLRKYQECLGQVRQLAAELAFV